MGMGEPLFRRDEENGMNEKICSNCKNWYKDLSDGKQGECIHREANMAIAMIRYGGGTATPILPDNNICLWTLHDFGCIYWEGA